MGLIKSKSPASKQADSFSDESTSDGLLESKRRPRRRLAPTPSPWISGEWADCSPENQTQSTSALGRTAEWSEGLGARCKSQAAAGQQQQRHISMLKKLVGRLSHKVRPHIDATTADAEPDGQRQRDRDVCTAMTCSSPEAARVTSTFPVHDGDCADAAARCQHHHHHCHLRTSLQSVYRATLQPCTDTTPTSHLNNNNNHDTPVENLYRKSIQVRVFDITTQRHTMQVKT